MARGWKQGFLQEKGKDSTGIPAREKRAQKAKNGVQGTAHLCRPARRVWGIAAGKRKEAELFALTLREDRAHETPLQGRVFPLALAFLQVIAKQA